MRILVGLITTFTVLASGAGAQARPQGGLPLSGGWTLFEFPVGFGGGDRTFVAKSSDGEALGLGIQCVGEDVRIAVTHRPSVEFGTRASIRYRFDGDESSDWERWRLQSPNDVSLIDATARPDEVHEFVRSLRTSSEIVVTVRMSDSRSSQRDTFSLEGAVGATDRLECVRRLLAGSPR